MNIQLLYVLVSVGSAVLVSEVSIKLKMLQLYEKLKIN